nr:hypothetical protein [Arthrobacter sp. SLBN-100]
MSNWQVFVAPDDWEANVTLAGSPPKAVMLRWTHSSAALLSMTP